MNYQQNELSDGRRIIVGVLAVVLLVASGIMTFWPGQSGSSNFAASASGRIGLVLAALCLAWPSLRRPANWLPPGIAMLFIVALAVIAANPRLVFVAVPALVGLTVLATFVRALRQ